MALLLVAPESPSENTESARHRGRPALTPEEREERRQARNQARREQRRAARAAAVVEVAPVPEPAPAPPVAEPEPVPAVVPPASTQGYPLLIRIALAVLGFALGAFVPLASYTEVHTEVAHRPLLWFLVAGGLIYSSTSVYSWAVKFLPHWTTAVGFVVLLELTLTFCGITWLSQAGLAILMMLNAINAATRLYASVPGKEPADESRPDSRLYRI